MHCRNLRIFFTKNILQVCIVMAILPPIISLGLYVLWGINGVLYMTFWGPYLTYLGTFSLGSITYVQKRKMNRRLMRFSRNLKKLFELYPENKKYSKQLENTQGCACLKHVGEKDNEFKVCYRLQLSFIPAIDNSSMQSIRVRYVQFYIKGMSNAAVLEGNFY